MMKRTARNLAGGVLLVCLCLPPAALDAQISLGTWVKQAADGKTPADDLTLTVEACCNGGRRLVYRMPNAPPSLTMVLESPFDGTEAPVLLGGKPTGETMAIKRVDDHHLVSVIKQNGKQFATSKATLSADGKTLTVETDVTSADAGQPLGKTTEIWIRKS
jgi:hypothetical protein